MASPSERATEVVKDRGTTYGDPTPIAETAAAFWNEWLRVIGTEEVIRPIDATDVQMMMALHKVARERHSELEDNLTDICGYVNIYERAKEAR
jgi:Domain of unknown function (DUF6378)